jgi:hypothetical protein
MSCQAYRESISLQIDEELDLRSSLELKQHLKACADCHQTQNDLHVIRSLSVSAEEYDPSAQVWARLENQLRAEGFIKPQRKWNFWRQWLPSFEMEAHFKPAIAGALVTLVLVFSGFFAYKTAFHPAVSVNDTEQVLMEVERAEIQYAKTIQDLEGISRQRLQRVNPNMARIFQDNLATMDYYLQECKDAVKKEPNSGLAQKYLLAAYQKKVELLESIVNSDLM